MNLLKMIKPLIVDSLLKTSVILLQERHFGPISKLCQMQRKKIINILQKQLVKVINEAILST